MVLDPRKGIYKPGEQVPIAGIYKVSHQKHRPPHEASLEGGSVFPACIQCGAEVSFELVVGAEETKS